MAKTICTLLGVVFLLVGLLGFVAADSMSNLTYAHLSTTHNIVHVLSGVIALYLGLKGTVSAAKTFCLVFGAVYLLLGVVGYFAGGASAPSAGIPGPHSEHMMKVLPGNLELGSGDHGIHILLGIVFLIGAFMTKADMREAVD